MAPAKSLIIYIHGFNSSSASSKAQLFRNYVRNHELPCELWIPDLPVWPGEAAHMLLRRALEASIGRPVHIIGSSLGGYYGIWLMENIIDHCPECPVKLVLINPVVRPCDLSEDYLGSWKNYHSGVEYELTREHVNQLCHLEVKTLSRPDNILLLVQTGDEILDYRQAVTRYAECPARIDEGGSHAYDCFDSAIPAVLQFLSAHYVAAVALAEIACDE